MIPPNLQVGWVGQLNVAESVCLRCGRWEAYRGIATYLGIHHDTHIFRWETHQACSCGAVLTEYHETVPNSLTGEIEERLSHDYLSESLPATNQPEAHLPALSGQDNRSGEAAQAAQRGQRQQASCGSETERH